MKIKKSLLLILLPCLLSACGAGPQGLQGVPGKDGITPTFKINDTTKEWEVSYDDGLTWLSLGISAVGVAGKTGTSAYETYRYYDPGYNKTEEEWIIDLVNGNLKKPNLNLDNTYYRFGDGLYGSGVKLSDARIVIDNNKLLWYVDNNGVLQEYDFVYSNNLIYPYMLKSEVTSRGSLYYPYRLDGTRILLVCCIEDGLLSVMFNTNEYYDSDVYYVSKALYCTEAYFLEHFGTK